MCRSLGLLTSSGVPLLVYGMCIGAHKLSMGPRRRFPMFMVSDVCPDQNLVADDVVPQVDWESLPPLRRALLNTMDAGLPRVRGIHPLL